MTQCLGRLVKDTKGVGLLPFQDGSVFHIPFRCERVTRNGELCEGCSEREKKTAEKVKTITGTTIQGMLPSFLNGRVTEPIPFWSRLYDGAWFRLKLESGCTVSEEVMAKAKKAAAIAYEGVEIAAPQPMPGARKVKKVSAAAVTAASAVTAAVAAPAAVPKATVKKRLKIPPAPVSVLAMVVPEEVEVESVREIHVRRIEVQGRDLYLDPQKEKLYDLKFKYLGRLKDGALVAFPDSDADV